MRQSGIRQDRYDNSWVMHYYPFTAYIILYVICIAKKCKSTGEKNLEVITYIVQRYLVFRMTDSMVSVKLVSTMSDHFKTWV